MWQWVSDILGSKKLLLKLGLAVLIGMWAMTYAPSTAYAAGSCPSTNELKVRYQSSCFPCQIVKVLVASFMKAASKVYDVSKEAGIKLLMLGSFIWLVFWGLRKVSALTNPEPMGMLNELFIFLGKILIAYAFIVSGIGVLIGYAINPILSAGADMGNSLLLETSVVDINADPLPENAYNGPTDIVSAEVMNKILKFSEGVSNEVATNLMIGNALTCYAIFEGINWDFIIHIHIPDIWLWLCGAAIWCAGFMLTLSVCYYLIDIPFKLGFAVIALPVVIGLWPFKMTSGKLKSCIEISLNAAGTFVFLALSSSYAMRLIGQALTAGGGLETTDATGNEVTLTGKDALMKALEDDKGEYIQQLFEITGPYFIIIMFCYIYGIKLISTVTNKYPGEFFGSGLTAGASPIHQMATGATNWLGQKAMAPVKLAGDIIANQAGKAATTVAKAGANVGIGAAGYVAGAALKPMARGIGGALSAHGSQKSTKGAQDLAALQQRGAELEENGNVFQKLGNKMKQSNAKFRTNLGAKLDRVGQKMPENAENLKSPFKQTFGRIRDNFGETTNALKESLGDLKDAGNTSLNDAAGYVPTVVGNKLSELGTTMMSKGQSANGSVVSAIAGVGVGQLGRVINSAGERIVNNTMGGIETKADERLAATIEKRGENVLERQTQRAAFTQDGRKALAYIKGTTVKGALKDAFNVACSKMAAAKDDFTKDVKEDWNRDLDKVSFNASSLIHSAKTFGDFKEKTADNIGTMSASAAALGQATVDVPGKMKRDFVQGVKDTHGSGTGVIGRVGENINKLHGNLFENVKSGFVDEKEAYEQADLIAMAASPVGGLVRTSRGLVHDNIETAYAATEGLALHAIDIGKTILSPTRAIGEVGFHFANTAVDASKVVIGSTLGSVVTIGANTVNTVGSSVKMVGRVALKSTGAVLAVGLSPVTYSAKLVDKTFGAATTAASLYVTQPVADALNVASHWVAATAPAKTIGHTLHTAKTGLKVGRNLLRVGTGLIKAAAGETGRRQRKDENKVPMTPEELAAEKAERAKNRDEERKKEDKERKIKEERKREEEQIKERAEQERERAEQERERQAEEQRRADARAEAEAEAQRLRDEEQNNSGNPV